MLPSFDGKDPARYGFGQIRLAFTIHRQLSKCTPPSWWRFETGAGAPRVRRPWWNRLPPVDAARERDRRPGGLCCERSAAIKPCAFGALLRRGCTA